VLIFSLLVESLDAYCFVLLLVSDCEMSARLEWTVVSRETGTRVDQSLHLVE